VYSAAKAGIHAYTQTLRLQLKKTNIRVIEVAPPGTDTPLNDIFKNELDSNMYMKVDKMVSVSIKGIVNSKMEIRPGMSNMMKIMSRIAPNFAINLLHNNVEKAKSKKTA
ncbi:MAG TPA: SDR family NAD(P)-dependent oxidoreductase, partial [Bacteroidales bacterium]